MEIYVYDRDINQLGVIDTFSSLQWTRSYFNTNIAHFELQCPVNSQTVALLQRGNIIWPDGDPEAAYINYRNLKLDDTGQEIIVVKGLFLTGYLAKRIPWEAVTYNGSAEAAMRDLVNRNAVNPSNSARVISHLVLGSLKGLTPTINYQAKPENDKHLTDSLTDIATASGLGYRILFDPKNKQLVFDVYAGLDRSVGQSANPRATFSRDYENVLTQEFTDSGDNVRNAARVDGKWTYQYVIPLFNSDGTPQKNDDGTYKTETKEADVPVTVSIGSTTGLDRDEQYYDETGVSSKTGDGDSATYMSQSAYDALISSTANTELAKRTEVQTFDSTINNDSNLKYKHDWNVGDIVTYVSEKWGVQVSTRITEVLEVYEEKGLTVTPTFGNNVPTLIDKIKQMRR